MESPKNEKNKTWNISELYRKSWKIIKENKILWLFGMAAATFTSTSSRMNFNSDSFKPILKLFGNTNTPNAPDTVNRVLGISTETASEIIKNLFLSVPTWIYVLLGIGVILVLLFLTALSVIYTAWANGTLLAGINAAAENKKPTISQSSHQAFSAIKGIIWLDIVPSLSFFLITGVVIAVLVAATILFSSYWKIIPILLLIAAIAMVVIGWILLSFTQIWATRRVVLDKKPAFESLKLSFPIVKNNFWHMAVIAILNTIIAAVTGFLMLLPILVIGGAAVLYYISTKPDSYILAGLIVVGVFLLLIFTTGSMLFSGILTSFKACVWTLAYKQIEGAYNE